MNIADRVKSALQTTRSHSLQEVKKEFLDLIHKRFPIGRIDYEDDTFEMYGEWQHFVLEGAAEVDDPDQQIIEWIDQNKDIIKGFVLSETNRLKTHTFNERKAIAEGYYNA